MYIYIAKHNFPPSLQYGTLQYGIQVMPIFNCWGRAGHMLGLYCPQAWDLGRCLHSPSCYALKQHYPLWPNEIQSPSNRFQSMFCFEDWMDFKSLELLQMGFKIPFALKIACAFKSFDEFKMGFKLPLVVKIARVSNVLQMSFKCILLQRLQGFESMYCGAFD